MSQVLLIQFRTSVSAATLEAESIGRELGQAITVIPKSALVETLLWSEPRHLLEEIDGVIFGGSGDFYFDGAREIDDPARSTSYLLLERLSPVIDFLFTQNIPTLGICFGHQLLGAFKGVAVRHDREQQRLNHTKCGCSLKGTSTFSVVTCPVPSRHSMRIKMC